MKQASLRLVFLQYGDFREASLHFAAGGEEYYHDQRFTVDFVEELARDAAYVGVITIGREAFDVRLPSGVQATGLQATSFEDPGVIAALERAAPTAVILRSPSLRVLRWARARRLPTLPLFADTFASGGSLGRRLRYWRIVRTLCDPHFRWIANHNEPASRSLLAAGVPAERIVPFDYESRWHERPANRSPKQRSEPLASLRLAFVGGLSEGKGLGDCIEAVGLLARRGVDAHLTVAGHGDRERFEARARDGGVASRVHFLGRIEHRQVIPLMRDHDAVLVASRPEYAEGMPGTIYEALCARTPLVVSDHPAFLAKLAAGEDVLVFRAGDAAHLADRLAELARSPALYTRLSEGADDAWQKLQCFTGWREVIERFLGGSPEDHAWLAAHSLAALDASKEPDRA